MKSEIWTRDEHIVSNRPVAWLPGDRYVEESPPLTLREWGEVILGAAVLIAVFVVVLLVVSLV